MFGTLICPFHGLKLVLMCLLITDKVTNTAHLISFKDNCSLFQFSMNIQLSFDSQYLKGPYCLMKQQLKIDWFNDKE